MRERERPYAACAGWSPSLHSLKSFLLSQAQFAIEILLFICFAIYVAAPVNTGKFK